MLLLYIIAKANSINNKSRITGQKYVSSILDMPYHTLVVYGYLYCSGSIIRSKIILTTASCLTAGRQDKIFVKVGSNSITDIGYVN